MQLDRGEYGDDETTRADQPRTDSEGEKAKGARAGKKKENVNETSGSISGTGTTNSHLPPSAQSAAPEGNDDEHQETDDALLRAAIRESRVSVLSNQGSSVANTETNELAPPLHSSSNKSTNTLAGSPLPTPSIRLDSSDRLLDKYEELVKKHSGFASGLFELKETAQWDKHRLQEEIAKLTTELNNLKSSATRPPVSPHQLQELANKSNELAVSPLAPTKTSKERRLTGNEDDQQEDTSEWAKWCRMVRTTTETMIPHPDVTNIAVGIDLLSQYFATRTDIEKILAWQSDHADGLLYCARDITEGKGSPQALHDNDCKNNCIHFRTPTNSGKTQFWFIEV